MDTRARISHLLRRTAFVAVAGALLAPVAAGAAEPAKKPVAQAAKKKSKSRAPVIRSVSPKNVAVGETLTIRGRNFRRGRGKNTVVFKRDRGRAVFVKADVGTKKLIKVVIPARLKSSMAIESGQPVPTRFRLRVLTTRLGKRFTRNGLSPVVGPERPKDGPPEASATGDCDGDKILNGADADDDNDLLPDTTEKSFKLDACKPDSDGDSVSDGFEYRSALDLNDDEHQEPNTFLPYPGKRPYPNPLDGTDGNTDFDGDSLTLTEEYKLWRFTVGQGAADSLDALTYSDGEQYTMSTRGADGRRRPTLAAAGYNRQAEFIDWLQKHGYWYVAIPFDTVRPLLDVNRSGGPSPIDSGPRADYLHSEDQWLDRDEDGYLSDDERDEDADGLSNFTEAHGEMSQGWWDKKYDRETPFRIAYAGTQLDDADTDGDGVRDGADDQDHDDVPNLVELSRNMVTGRDFDSPRTSKNAEFIEGSTTERLREPYYGRVNPFNPCLPLWNSRTCPRVIEFGNTWAPFDGPTYGDRPFAGFLGEGTFAGDPEGDDPNYLVRN
jgi:hypothetical protein